ncbi:MAG TPA: hypothetical protein VH496_16830 [Mycobacterium sp.]
MVATLELQVSADTFAASILAALQGTPRCLPSVAAGFQLQQVHYRAVSLRHSTETSFQVLRDPDYWYVGQPWDWITALQTQIAVEVTVDVALDATIAAHPNELVAPAVSLDATVTFNLDCKPGSTIGWLELLATFDDVDIPIAATLPGGISAKSWLKARLSEVLTISPQRLDFSASLPPGASFLNAGVTVDRAGTILAIRAEQPMGGQGWARWTDFLNGSIENLVGANDWSIVIGSADLTLTLHTLLFNALNDAVKTPYVEVISLGVDYSAQPGHAIFTVTPYLRFVDAATEDFPVRVDISLDPVAGHLLVDIDAYGIRDLIDSALPIVDVIVNLLFPFVGPFLSAALRDLVAAASSVGPSLAGGGVLPEGTTVQEVPGQQFRYLATIPFSTPAGINGRITELIASTDAVAIAGTWRVLHFVDGSMVVDVSQFIWAAPDIACGEMGEAVYAALAADDPQMFAHLYSQIELTPTESAPVRLCDVSVISPLDPGLGVQIAWTASELPTVIEVNAPGSSEPSLPDPLVLEVRTTAGIFRAEMASPGPLTPEDAERIRAIVGVQVAYCDSIVTPPWFSGEHKFDLGWIVDPLADPDPDLRHSLIDVIALQVNGLEPGATLVLADPEGLEVASAVASAARATTIRLARAPASPAPSASVRRIKAKASLSALPQHAGIQVTRERLHVAGQISVSKRIVEVVPAPALGAAQFLLRQSDGCLLLDTSHASNPNVTAQWTLPGVRAVAATGAGLFAFGEGGTFLLDVRRHKRAERLGRTPMLLASGNSRYIAAVGYDKVEVLNACGGLIAVIPLSAPATGVSIAGNQLLLSTEAETAAYQIAAHGVEPRDCLHDLPRLRLTRADLDRATYGARKDGSVVALIADKHGWHRVGEYSTEPWSSNAATMGRTVIHRGNGLQLTVLRRPPRAALVPVPSTVTPPCNASVTGR